ALEIARKFVSCRSIAKQSNCRNPDLLSLLTAQGAYQNFRYFLWQKAVIFTACYSVKLMVLSRRVRDGAVGFVAAAGRQSPQGLWVFEGCGRCASRWVFAGPHSP